MKKLLNLIILGCLVHANLISQEIAQWRGPGRDGIYNETGLLKVWPENGPTLLWHFEGLGEGHSSAAVTSDRIYTAGTLQGIGYLFCFDLAGKPVWKIPYGEEWTENWPGVRSTPLICNDDRIGIAGIGIGRQGNGVLHGALSSKQTRCIGIADVFLPRAQELCKKLGGEA